MTALYNEIEPYAARWLENLIAAEHIAKGDVDARSIAELRATDLVGRTQCHFFAGIGVWSHALRLAGWPDDREVWTGSCPCQPFSAAGKGGGFDDERHLWPTWFALIRECRPSVVFGEQVASPDGLKWLDLVHADLEGAGYAVGVADLCAAGVGAPHIRQRLWFVAYADDARSQGRIIHAQRRSQRAIGASGMAVNVADSDGQRLEGKRIRVRERRPRSAGAQAARSGSTGGMGNASHDGDRQHAGELPRDESEHGEWTPHGDHAPIAPSATSGYWERAEWLACTDGVSRPVEPGPQQMADGFAESMGRLRTGTIDEIKKALTDADISDRDAREALRDLWLSNAEEAVRRSPGRCRSVHEAPVLLAYLRELARAGWGVFDDLPSSCWEDARTGLRAMQANALEAPRSSSRRGREQQRAVESSNALPIVSQAIALSLAGNWVMPHPLAHGAPSRVGRLRAYGNAIVSEVAATFIRAAMESIP